MTFRTLHRALAGSFLLAAALLLMAAPVATAGKPRAPRPKRVPPVAPIADSATVALWRFDETGGAHVADSGPFRLSGTASIETRPEFGRYRNARMFQPVLQSFAIVPWNPALDVGRAFTIEAWIYVNDQANYEMQTIAGRWSPDPNEQSWVLGVCGRGLRYPAVTRDSPGWFRDVTAGASVGRLVFAFRPADAALTQTFSSSADLPLQKWVHVAATVDGQLVRLWVDGRVEGQFANNLTVRATRAPLVVGSTLDERRLSDFGGDLQVDATLVNALYYQFDGAVDELRLSNRARTGFESVPAR